MAGPFTIACPHCATKLRVRPEAAGKKLRCPDCESVMRVPAPAAPAYDDYWDRPEYASSGTGNGDDRGDGAYGGYGTYSPPRPRRRKPRRKQEKPKWVMPTAIVGGTIAAFLLLAAMIYAVSRLFSVDTLHSDEPLAYVTVDSEVVLIVRVDDPEMAKEFRQGAGLKDLEEFTRSLGLKVEDLELIAIGDRDVRVFGHSSDNIVRGETFLFQFKRKISGLRLTLGNNKVRHAGKTYFRDPTRVNGMVVAGFLANDRTLVIAEESRIKSILEHDSPTIAGSRFSFADFKATILIAEAPSGHAVSKQKLPNDPGLHTEISDAATILDGDFRGIAVSWRFGADIEATTRVQCAEPAEATQIAAVMSASPQKRRELADHLTPQFISSRPGVINEGMRSLQIAANGSVVTISTRFAKRR